LIYTKILAEASEGLYMSSLLYIGETKEIYPLYAGFNCYSLMHVHTVQCYTSMVIQHLSAQINLVFCL